MKQTSELEKDLKTKMARAAYKAAAEKYPTETAEKEKLADAWLDVGYSAFGLALGLAEKPTRELLHFMLNRKIQNQPDGVMRDALLLFKGMNMKMERRIKSTNALELAEALYKEAGLAPEEVNKALPAKSALERNLKERRKTHQTQRLEKSKTAWKMKLSSAASLAS